MHKSLRAHGHGQVGRAGRLRSEPHTQGMSLSGRKVRHAAAIASSSCVLLLQGG